MNEDVISSLSPLLSTFPEDEMPIEKRVDSSP